VPEVGVPEVGVPEVEVQEVEVQEKDETSIGDGSSTFLLSTLYNTDTLPSSAPYHQSPPTLL